MPPSRTPTNQIDAYRQLALHERGIWLSTIAVMVMSGATIAILTLGAWAGGGVAGGMYRAFVLAGSCLVLLLLFGAYSVVNRNALERNRVRILRELESRSSQLQEANHAMENAFKARDVLLNSVSHELKTPLTAMLAYAEYLSSETLERSEAQRYAETILVEGKGLLRLIGQLVDVSSLRSGVIHLKWQEADLALLTREAVERVAPDAAARGVSLDVEAGGAFLAWVDPRRMGQIIETLVHDAVSHSPAGSRVGVRVGDADMDWIQLEVEDASPRTPDGDALFQPFAQIDPEPQGRRGDLGLGLPLARRLVLAHGGLLKVSSARSKGLSFAVLIPKQNLLTPGATDAVSQDIAA
jgi:signal transduction histidine kinase